MGVTLTTFADGAACQAAPVVANFSTIESYMNGGIVAADIASAQVETKHIFKPEHYPSPLQGSLGVSGDVYGSEVGMDRYDRSYHFWDLLSTQYNTVDDCMKTVYIDASSWVELCLSAYIQIRNGANVGAATGLTGTLGFVRFTDNNTTFASTVRRIVRHDPGNTTTVLPSNKDMLYINHMFQVTSTGWHNFGAEIRVVGDDSATAARAARDDAAGAGWNGSHDGIIIWGKSLTVEVHVL